MKTHVITVAKKYPRGHKRGGQLTGFKTKIIAGSKIHTIRLNFNYWKKKIDQIMAGEAVLSLREWTGKPYNSPQEEFARLDFSHGVGIERIKTNYKGYAGIPGGPSIDRLALAQNDGLLFSDFIQWFPGSFQVGTKVLDAGIIHFTPFRYDSRSKVDTTKADSRKKPGNIVVGFGPENGIPFEGQTN